MGWQLLTTTTEDSGPSVDQTMTLTIPSTTTGGDSGRGTSYWLSFLGCPHRYVLDKETGMGGEAAKVGILFHKLCELYYTGKLKSVALQYGGGADDPEWLEALRLFAGYRKVFPPGEWQVDSCERDLKATNPEKYGVDIFTGRADMLVTVNKAQAELIRKTRKIDLTPGRYLVDYKTKKQRSSTWPLEFGGSLQFHAYMMMLEEMGEPVLGTIASVVIRHTELDQTKGKPDPGKSFHSYFVPPPTDYHRRYVKSSLAKCMAMRDTFGQDKNPHDCFSYMKVCPHLESGICDRSPSGDYEKRCNDAAPESVDHPSLGPQGGKDVDSGDDL